MIDMFNKLSRYFATQFIISVLTIDFFLNLVCFHNRILCIYIKILTNLFLEH